MVVCRAIPTLGRRIAVAERQPLRLASRRASNLSYDRKPSADTIGVLPSSAHPPTVGSSPPSWLKDSRSFASAPTVQPSITLYQYHICPFCNIAKALLAYTKSDFQSVEVNPLTKSELKPWSGEYRKVPIALIDGKQLNGSEDIVDSLLNSPEVRKTLEKRWESELTDDERSTMNTQQFMESDSAKRWATFAREDLAALLYPNICGSIGDSYDAFRYVDNVESFSALQKMSIHYLGALAMHFAASKVKSKRNITDEKAALRKALDTFEGEGLQNGDLMYSSGLSCPDMGDLAVFGVLYSVRGLKAHDEAIQCRGGPVKDWYERMQKEVALN
ncbi:hypothetical protein ACHAWF_009106 [Thalassiosira exigua]